LELAFSLVRLAVTNSKRNVLPKPFAAVFDVVLTSHHQKSILVSTIDLANSHTPDLNTTIEKRDWKTEIPNSKPYRPYERMHDQESKQGLASTVT